jgi:hypothetical protein
MYRKFLIFVICLVITLNPILQANAADTSAGGRATDGYGADFSDNNTFRDNQTPVAGDETPILIRAPNANPNEFESFARANGFRIYSDVIDQTPQDTELSTTFGNLLKAAQSSWLDGSLDRARSQFEKLAALAFVEDWREAQREAIHYAYLRLAQLSKPGPEQVSWLNKAVIFAADLEPDPEIFAPPISQAYKEAQAAALAKSNSVALLAEMTTTTQEAIKNFRLLKINGHKVALNQGLDLRLAKGKYRFTTLSDSHVALSKILPAGDLSVLGFSEAMPFIKGTCSQPQISHPPKGAQQFSVYFSKNCIRSFNGESWVKRTRDIASEESNQSGIFGSFGKTLFDHELPLNEPEPSAGLSKNGLIWAGIGALAIGAAFMVKAEQDRKRNGAGSISPVQREGF